MPGKEKSKPEEEGGIAKTIRFWVSVLFLFLLVRSFLIENFHIPSESMEPTLLVGDAVAVTKFAYGYSRYSFPFSPPLFSGRILASPPQRGDVVVFRSPSDTAIDLIKRVVGLPGDRIQMIGSRLQINGSPVKRERMDDFLYSQPGVGTMPVRRWRETLPNGVSYSTLDLMDHGPLDDTPVYSVPAGHYFMMGDNRDDSADSRILEDVGYVPFENIVGRAEIIYFSIGEGAAVWQVWRWPWAVRWRRIFTTLR